MIDKARDWWRAAVSRGTSPREYDPPGVTIPLSLVRSAQFASWMAYFCLVYFLWLYTLDIARDRAGAMHLTHVGGWVGDLRFWFPYIVGFAVVAIGIPYVAKIAIPVFMSLRWRPDGWAKAWALFIALAVSCVVIAGTFTVQGDTLLERDRESAVAVDTVAQEAAVLQARIDDVQHRLDEMTGSASQYIRTAASMSPEAYDRFVEARRDDWQYERLRSYRATAEEAERLRGEIAALRAQQAAQRVASSVAARVTTERTSWIADTLAWLEGARAMLLSLVMDIVCLIMPWIAMRLEQARSRQLATAGVGPVTDEAHLIEDLRDDEAPTPQPMDPPREVIRDAETGEELIRVNIKKKSYLRRKKGRPQPMETTAGVQEDERGVAKPGTGDERFAVTMQPGNVFGAPEAPEAPPEPEEVIEAPPPPKAPEEIDVEALLGDDDLPVIGDQDKLPNNEGVLIREKEEELA